MLESRRPILINIDKLMKSLTNYISNSTLAILIFALVAVSSVASFFVAGKAMALPITPPITSPVTPTPTTRPTATPTLKPTATPTVKPTVTPTIKPTVTPTIRPTATPTLGACTVFGSSILDQTGGDTYTAQLLSSTWGMGESPIYKLTKNGKFDKVEFYVSGNGLMQVKVVDAKGNVVSDQPVKIISGSTKWVTFDFISEPIVRSGQSYTVLFRAASGTVYVHRGNFWNWARKFYLKPCLN